MAFLLDPLDEGWPSMDLVGELLYTTVSQAFRDIVSAHRLQPALPRVFRALPARRRAALLLNADRVLGRFLTYPALALAQRARFDLFHIVDHSYAHLAHALPPGRFGVYCHDVDAFRSLLSPEREARPAWFKLMARRTFTGLQKAAIVFHSTEHVRGELLAHRVVEESRLVHAPYGPALEFSPAPSGAALEAFAPGVEGRFVLHIGAALPRKRLDVLIEVFARSRSVAPGMKLVQVGAKFPEALERRIDELEVRSDIIRLSRLSRAELATLYQRAAAVLVPSEAEGFGLPVLEALACGSPVIASDIASLREVGGDAVVYCPVGDIAAWSAALGAQLRGTSRAATFEQRLARASCFSWTSHARSVLRGYRDHGLLPSTVEGLA